MSSLLDSAALVGNLGGLTSFLLSLDGGRAAAALRADVLIPVLGYKRALNKQTGYGKLSHVTGCSTTTPLTCASMCTLFDLIF
jgi:hypothetical protein